MAQASGQPMGLPVVADGRDLGAALQAGDFAITVEVLPPTGADAEPLLGALEAVADLPFHGFSVATNPVARAHMSALALCALLQARTGKPATLHCTTRDHNRLSVQGLLWGALALGIHSVLVTTGDYVALEAKGRTTSGRDLGVNDLVLMARQAGLLTGVALDPRSSGERLDHEVQRLELKARAGAQFVVTQPVFAEVGAERLLSATRHIGIPVLLGILPLRTARHASYLHDSIAGITVPDVVRARMESASEPKAEGIAGAREVLRVARERSAGACIMPPFGRYEILADIMA